LMRKGDELMDESLKNFLQQMFQIVEGMERQASQDANFRTCAECGTTYNGFKKTGKLGCGYCYTTFRDHISQALKNIHGSNRHAGKLPHGQDEKYADLMIKREIEKVRLLMEKAVFEEDFLEADRYQKIKKELEAELGGGADGKMV
ncbi:MAG: hypothetical protein FWC67_04835, partial [Defluviitaleaceae bacterium]|nr:hypothetical protein [Defluviitaleaceae bacterium]